MTSFASRLIADPIFEVFFDAPFNVIYVLDPKIAKLSLEVHQKLCKVSATDHYERLPEAAINNTLLVGILRNLFLTTSNVSQIIVRPDLSPSCISDTLTQTFTTQDAAFKNRNKAALSILDNASDMFRDRFHIYYRNYIMSGDVSVFVQSAINDCAKLTNNTEAITQLGKDMFSEAKKRFGSNSQLFDQLKPLESFFETSIAL